MCSWTSSREHLPFVVGAGWGVGGGGVTSAKQLRKFASNTII